MPEMHLKRPGFIYSAFGPFTKNKEIVKKIKETSDSRYIYQDKLDKACFQHDMAYRDFKDLNRRTAADKVLYDKALNIAKDPKYDGYERRLASVVYKFFDKKLLVAVLKTFLIKNLQKNYRKQLFENFIKESTLTFCRQYLGCRSSRYATDKQV